MRTLTAIVVTALALTSTASASITPYFDGGVDVTLVEATSPPWPIVVNSLLVDTDTEFLNANLAINLTAGSFYQHPFGTIIDPNPALMSIFPDLNYDSYVCSPGYPNPPHPDAFLASVAWTATSMDVSWFDSPGVPLGPGLGQKIAQISLSPDAQGTVTGWVFDMDSVGVGVTFGEWVILDGRIPGPGPEPTTLAINIDIKPGSDINPVNLQSKGMLPVTIFGSVQFDVTQIDLDTLSLGGATPKAHGKSGNVGAIVDENGDSFLDLVLHFETEGLDIESDANELTLTGNLLGELGEAEFEGSDSIRIVPLGDLNANRIVDGADLGTLLTHWNTSDPLADIAPIGAPDGIVDGADLGELLSHWKETSGTQAAPAIPEPATMTLFALGGLALMRRRK